MAYYNSTMRIERLHDWNVNIQEAVEIQRSLSGKVLQNNDIICPHLIAGLDLSINKFDEATAVAVVLSYPELKLVETAKVRGKVEFPYVPGLLSFREVPLTLQVCEKLDSEPDLVMVDGQGIAHPRRIGLASHLGLFLSVPTIGCAKSHLYGTFKAPGPGFGSTSKLIGDKNDTIGAVVRTKTNVKPLFVSIGHRIDLSSAVHWVLQCCQGYRLPEPTRLAHLATKENF